MADIIDEAQDSERHALEAAILRVRARADKPRPFAPLWEDGNCVCVECGEVIPAARIAAIPGVCFCVICQDQWDEHDTC